jgi:citrate lyase gamma subunit
MAEKHKTGHESEKLIPAEADEETEGSENDSGVIELSDIAIGITPEDDAIVELTEELIGEAFIGFAGATSEFLDDDERRLDLSETFPGLDPSPDDSRSGIDSKTLDQDADFDDSDMENDNLEADITHELDNYFGTEEAGPVIEETTPIDSPINQAKSMDETEEDSGVQAVDEKKIQLDEISVSSRQLDDALERVIRKMFAEKINRILDEMIERTVSEEISQLKDYLIGISEKE